MEYFSYVNESNVLTFYRQSSIESTSLCKFNYDVWTANKLSINKKITDDESNYLIMFFFSFEYVLFLQTILPLMG